MGKEQEIREVFAGWRLGIKKKFRGIADFHERAQMRFEVVLDAIFPKKVPLNEWQIRRAYHRGIDDYEWIDPDWWTIQVGENWGGPNYTAFFRRSAEVPDELAGERLVLRMFTRGDGLLKVNGKPYHGLDPFRYVVPLAESAEPGARYDFELETYMSWHWGNVERNNFELADLAAFDAEVWRVYWDLRAAEKLLDIPNIDPDLADFVEHNLWEAMKLIPLQSSDPRALRRAILAAGEAARATIYRAEGHRIQGLMHLVGHSHLDVVYMWPYREFVRKIGRTHATMLRLMEQYPEFTFAQSQAKLYADMKTYWPDLYEQVKARIAEGRWEPIGAFWVEPDCNLISGESFVRQVLYGQLFFEREFGLRSRTCWQPDVFGMSWAMPQILARSGVEYVLTNKMVPWNDTNPWTLNTFWWEGVDGSRVMGIVPPGHFIGTVDPDDIHTQWRSFSDRATVGETLHIFGWGDGGGGPDPEEIESGLRYRDCIGMPRMEYTTCEKAFDSIREAARGVDLPVLADEVYLEAHRGTFTNKGRLKKLNRRGEYLLRETEMAAAFAWLAGGEYPADQIETAWKDLLGTQFHDAVPGTHTTEVYNELLEDYDRIRGEAAPLRDAAVTELLGGPADEDGCLVATNALLHERSDTLSVPFSELVDRAVLGADGAPLPQQRVTDLDGRERLLVRVGGVPGVGIRRLGLAKTAGEAPAAEWPKADGRSLENEHLRAEFNGAGELTRLLDKDAGREVLVAGEAGNRFELFEDTPGRYDAWDLVETYQDHPIDISGNAELTVDETGPVRASLLLARPCAGSRIRQRISLEQGARQLTFETEVHWVERQRILKVAFPFEIHATHATFDMAFGSIQRPNHRNSSYDKARFEVCGHEWADLSQGDYGVSLLNDCKYGHDVLGKRMRLTLLKGSIYPDPEADKETHYFTYAVYPHCGGWAQAGTIRRARELNAPMRACIGPAGEETGWFLSCDATNVTLEAVKRSEDGEHLIVRLVERGNGSPAGTLRLARPIEQAWSCNLLEEAEDELPVAEGGVALRFRPFEIKTIRLAVSEG